MGELSEKAGCKQMPLLVVYMKSRYDIYIREGMETLDKNPEKNHLKNVHEAHTKTLEKIIELLNRNRIAYDLFYRSELAKTPLSMYNCVITVGGDGTLLETADYLKNGTPIVMVNSGVYYDEEQKMRRGSEGAFAAMDAFDIEEKFPLFLEGKLPATMLNRLAVEYNGRVLDHLVLNEVSVGPNNPHKSMQYIIRTKGFEEKQTSSGLIISLPGNPLPLQFPGGSVLHPEEKVFQAVTKANYNSRYHLENGIQKTDGIILKHPNWIEVESMDRTATIALDGEHKQYPFSFGTKIRVYLSDCPLKIIGFNGGQRDGYYNTKRNPVIKIVE